MRTEWLGRRVCDPECLKNRRGDRAGGVLHIAVQVEEEAGVWFGREPASVGYHTEAAARLVAVSVAAARQALLRQVGSVILFCLGMYN